MTRSGGFSNLFWHSCAMLAWCWLRVMSRMWQPSIARPALPIALYEFVTDLNDYLTEHDTGLDFARVVAQAKSPMVKDALIGLAGAAAISETAYREALGTHHPKLREAYGPERGVAVMIFPTTPLPAVCLFFK